MPAVAVIQCREQACTVCLDITAARSLAIWITSGLKPMERADREAESDSCSGALLLLSG